MNFWNEAAGSYFSHTDLTFAYGVLAGEQFEISVQVWSWFIVPQSSQSGSQAPHGTELHIPQKVCGSFLYGLN